MKVLVAVPIYNEEKYVEPVLREIRKYVRASHNLDGQAVETRVLVVDDGSTDRTPEVLSAVHGAGHIDLITHPENRGYGQSLIDAFCFSRRHDYDWVITMDCDEQHEPCRVPFFVRECLADDADIISGSRYLQTDSDQDQPPADRRNINGIITHKLKEVLGLELTDSFCGFKAHRVALLNKLHLTIPGYAFPMQFWVQAVRAGARIRELPVRLIYKDATRHFGGNLDDPTARLEHYMEVLHAALAEPRSPQPDKQAACCRH